MIVPPQYREREDQSDQYSYVRPGVPKPMPPVFTGSEKHKYTGEDEKHMIFT